MITRVALYVDGGNAFFMQQRQGWHIDPIKLLQWTAKFGHVFNATWYLGIKNNRDMEAFRNLMVIAGYTVITKEVKEYYRSGGSINQKANMDVEMAIDAIVQAQNYDTVILLTNDGDFSYLAEQLVRMGKEVVVVALQQGLAIELRNAATKYIDIETIRSEIERVYN